MMLRVNEEGVEYLPTLATHSLEAVEVPEAVVKEWRRRKGAAAAEAEHAHQLEQAGVVLETASIDRPSSGAGRGSPVAQTLSRLGHYLRRIKKMVPLDERGMWLLKNLLTQVRLKELRFRTLRFAHCPCFVGVAPRASAGIVFLRRILAVQFQPSTGLMIWKNHN